MVICSAVGPHLTPEGFILQRGEASVVPSPGTFLDMWGSEAGAAEALSMPSLRGPDHRVASRTA